jgi:hypothetical protein
MKIPKKYSARVSYVDHDEDGWWIGLQDGWCWSDQGLHTIHEDTQAAALSCLAEIVPCKCEQCKHA